MATPQKPKNLGEYYLLERIAVGGMAEIFKAKTYGVGGFEKLVAIKRILPHHAQNQEFITMLIDEAKIAVALNHVNIVQVYDLGKFENDYFIAMEFVEGRDLRTVMRRCKKLNIPITLENAVYIILEICKGLDYAHRKTDKSGAALGVVHRDISPQNILISFEGEVKIVDFGIAKAANKVTETEAGILKGKFSYMSPEQAQGKEVDRRTDIFSTGLMMFELLSGEKFFQGQNHIEILEKIRNTYIEPPFLPATVPSELEYILAHALSHDLEERYQWASEFQVELTKFLYSQSLDFTARNLAELMKRIFQDDLEDDRKKDKVDFELDEDTRSLMLKSHSESLVSKTDLAVDETTNDSTDTGERPRPTKNRTIIKKFQKILRRDYIPSKPKHAEAQTDKVPMASDIPPPYRVVVSTRPMIEVNRTVNESTEPVIALNDTLPAKGAVAARALAPAPPPPPRPTPKPKATAQPESLLQQWLETFAELSPARKAAGVLAVAAVLLFLFSIIAIVSKNTGHSSRRVIQPLATHTPQAAPAPGKPKPGASVLPGETISQVDFDPTLVHKRAASLRLQTNPPGAKVTRDGEHVLGDTPFRLVNIPADERFELTVRARNFQVVRETYSLSAGEEKNVQINLEPLYGSIEVSSSPPGAQVLLDKKLIGTTPLHYDKVLPDTAHTLTIAMEGFEEFTVPLRLGAEESRVFNKALEEANRNFLITSTPPGAQIFLNGTQYGITPRQFKNFEINRDYLLVLRLGGYRDYLHRIRLNSGSTRQMAVRLEPADRRIGSLYLDTEPQGAAITMNGKRLSQNTPALFERLRTDQVYSVQLNMPQFEPVEFGNVRVDPEQIVIRKVNLIRLKGRLTVMSDPPNASVLLNNRPVGETPLAYYPVDSGVDFVLTLKKPGYKDQIKTLKLEPRQAQTVKIQMEALPAPKAP